MPIRKLYRRAVAVHPELPRYLLAIAMLSVCGGVFENTYNNYLYARFDITGETRGYIELVREFPGLINALLMGALAFLPEARIAAFSALVTAVGMFGFGIMGDTLFMMLFFSLFWGVGSHLIMPVRASLTMSLGGANNKGRRLGQVGSVAIVGSIIGAALVWIIFDLIGGNQGTKPQDIMRIPEWKFDIAFYAAGIACIIGALWFFSLRSVGAHAQRQPLVLKRKYWLYYVLNVLFGARKQVFLTFGRWVLVEVFKQTPATFAKLWIVSSSVGVLFNPVLGRLVDRLGERKVLVFDSFVLMLVCFGYGGAKHLGLPDFWALMLVFACFIVDQLFFAVGMARDTYMAKIAESPRDLTASLSLGISINHLIAMTVPSFGSMLWKAYGYESVFMAAGVVAIMMTFFASRIRVPHQQETHQSELRAGG